MQEGEGDEDPGRFVKGELTTLCILARKTEKQSPAGPRLTGRVHRDARHHN